MKFAISITETLSTVVIADAADKDEAEDKVRKQYQKSEIVLDADNFQDVDFQHEPDYVIDELLDEVIE